MILSHPTETGAPLGDCVRQKAAARFTAAAVTALAGFVLAAPASAQQPKQPPISTQPPATMPVPAQPAQRAAPAVPAVPQADIAGLWVDHTGRGAVEIAPCATPADSKLCGHIVWLQTTVDDKGRPLVDHKNPDTRKRKNPICGVQVIGDLARVGQGPAGAVWGSGWIYDPEEGQNFDVEVKLLAPDRLSVMGYAGFKFLSETYIWKRAPATTAAARCAPARV